MEWLLLWLALSAISLEGVYRFVQEESLFGTSKEIWNFFSERHGLVIGALDYILIMIGIVLLFPVTLYKLLDTEE